MTAHPQHVVKNTLPSNRPFPDEIPFGPRDRYSYVDEAGVSIVSNGSYSEPAKSGFLPLHGTAAIIRKVALAPYVRGNQGSETFTSRSQPWLGYSRR